MASVPEGDLIARNKRARNVLLCLASVGLLVFAAVATIAVLPERCQFHQDCLGVDVGSCLEVAPGSRLLTGTVSRKCEVVAGNYHFPLSERARWIIDEIKRAARLST